MLFRYEQNNYRVNSTEVNLLDTYLHTVYSIYSRTQIVIMADAVFSKVGTKGFKSRADVEAYVAAFNTDTFETYFQYYHPDIYVS